MTRTISSRATGFASSPSRVETLDEIDFCLLLADRAPDFFA